MSICVVSPSQEYLETLGTINDYTFGQLAEKILFTRPFATPVKMYWAKDSDNPLKHLVFGNINDTTLKFSSVLSPENISNKLYHIHGHYNYDDNVLNQKIIKTGQDLIENLKSNDLLTQWFLDSDQNYSFYSEQDGPHKPGSWAIYLKNTSSALEHALNWLIENNGPKEPYFIHAVTDRDPYSPGPNLKDHIQNLILIGDQSVDWTTQFEYQWIFDNWVKI